MAPGSNTSLEASSEEVLATIPDNSGGTPRRSNSSRSNTPQTHQPANNETNEDTSAAPGGAEAERMYDLLTSPPTPIRMTSNNKKASGARYLGAASTPPRPPRATSTAIVRNSTPPNKVESNNGTNNEGGYERGAPSPPPSPPPSSPSDTYTTNTKLQLLEDVMKSNSYNSTNARASPTLSNISSSSSSNNKKKNAAALSNYKHLSKSEKRRLLKEVKMVLGSDESLFGGMNYTDSHEEDGTDDEEEEEESLLESSQSSGSHGDEETRTMYTADTSASMTHATGYDTAYTGYTQDTGYTGYTGYTDEYTDYEDDDDEEYEDEEEENVEDIKRYRHLKSRGYARDRINNDSDSIPYILEEEEEEMGYEGFRDNDNNTTAGHLTYITDACINILCGDQLQTWETMGATIPQATQCCYGADALMKEEELMKKKCRDIKKPKKKRDDEEEDEVVGKNKPSDETTVTLATTGTLRSSPSSGVTVKERLALRLEEGLITGKDKDKVEEDANAFEATTNGESTAVQAVQDDGSAVPLARPPSMKITLSYRDQSRNYNDGSPAFAIESKSMDDDEDADNQDKTGSFNKPGLFAKARSLVRVRSSFSRKRSKNSETHQSTTTTAVEDHHPTGSVQQQPQDQASVLSIKTETKDEPSTSASNKSVQSGDTSKTSKSSHSGNIDEHNPANAVVAVTASDATATTTKKSKKKKGIWKEYTDPISNKKYYSNGIITTWERPQNVDIKTVSRTSAPASTSASTPVLTKSLPSRAATPTTPIVSNKRDDKFVELASVPLSSLNAEEDDSRNDKEGSSKRGRMGFKSLLSFKKSSSKKKNDAANDEKDEGGNDAVKSTAIEKEASDSKKSKNKKKKNKAKKNALPPNSPVKSNQNNPASSSPDRTVGSSSICSGEPASINSGGENSVEVSVVAFVPRSYDDTTKTTKKNKRKQKGWREYTDPKSGKKYYSDGVTTTWVRHVDYYIPTAAVASSSVSTIVTSNTGKAKSTRKRSSKRNKKKGWREYTDTYTGKKYYSDGVTTTWVKPSNFDDQAVVQQQ